MATAVINTMNYETIVHRFSTMLRNTLCMVPCCIAIMSSTSSAQIAGIQEAMKPEFFTRDLIVFIEGLDLDDTQQIIVEALFDDYEHGFDEGMARMELRIEAVQEEIKELRDDPQINEKVLTMVVAPIEQWMQERDELGDQLIENVRVILIPEQGQLWVEFTRDLYINKKLTQGVINGESVNINHVLRDMSLDPATLAIIEQARTDHANELYAALQQRSRLSRGTYTSLMETINAADSQEETDRKLEVVDARVRVREVNDRGIQAIAETLQGDAGNQFWYEAMKRSYPRIFRRTPAQRVLEAAAANTNYALDIQDAIDQLLANYMQELGQLNDRILEATRDYDPEKIRESLRNRQRKKNGEATTKTPDPTRPLLNDRKELGKVYIERLRELLTPEQFEAIDGSRRFAPPPSAQQAPPAGLELNKRTDRNMTPAGKDPGSRNVPSGIGQKQAGPKGQRNKNSDKD